MKIQHIVVGGVLIIDGKALLIRRAASETSSAGYWEFPKGKVEWGEDPATALKREFLEEVNLKIELQEVHHVYSHSYNRDGDQIHFWEVEYMVELASNEDMHSLKLSPDHDDYKLVNQQESEELLMYKDRRDSLIKALK